MTDFLPDKTNDQPPDLVDKTTIDQPPDLVDPIHDNYLTSKQSDPEKASQIVKTASQINESPEYVENHLDDLKNVGDTKSPKYFQDMKENHPNTYGVLSAPDTIKQMPDTESMEGAKKIEDHIKTFGLFHQLAVLHAKATDPHLLLEEWPEEIGEHLLAGIAMLEATALHVMQVPNEKNTYLQYASYFGAKSPDSIIGKVAESIPTAALMFGAAYAGQPELIPWISGTLTYAESHLAATEAGATPGQALVTSAMKGALGFGLSTVGMGALSTQGEKMIGEIGLNATWQKMKRIGTTIGISMFGLADLNAVQMYGNAFADKVTGANPNAFDNLNERILEQTPSSLILGILFAVPGANAIAEGAPHPKPEAEIALKNIETEKGKQVEEALAPVKEKMEQRTKTSVPQVDQISIDANNNEKAFIKQMGVIASDMPIAKRNPDVLADLIKANVKDTPLANVYVPAKAWDEFHTNQGDDPAKVAEQWGLKDTYNENKLRPETGLLKIPMETWVKNISGKPIEESLMNDAKLSEMGKTTNELKEEGKETQTATREAKQPKKSLGELFQKAKELFEKKPEEKLMTETELTSKKETEEATDVLGLTHKPIEGLNPTFDDLLNKSYEQIKSEAESKLNEKQETELNPEAQEKLEKQRTKFTEWATNKVNDDPRTIALNHLMEAKVDIEKSIDEVVRGVASPEIKTRFDIESELAFGPNHNGFTLATALNKYNPQEQIDALVKQSMAPYETPLRERPDIKDEAYKSLHTEKTLEALSTESSVVRQLSQNNPIFKTFKKGTKEELESAAQKTGLAAEAEKSIAEYKRQMQFEGKVRAAQAKYDADEILSKKGSKEGSNPIPFYVAEKKAAVLFEKSVNKGDIQGAWKAKDEQVLNHALAMQAWKNKAERARGIKIVDRYADRGQDMKGQPYGHLKIIDSITEGMGKKTQNTTNDYTDRLNAIKYNKSGMNSDLIADKTGMVLDKTKGWQRETIGQFLDRIEPECRGLKTIVTPDIIAAIGKPLKELQTRELKGLKDSILTIAHDGLQKTHGETGEYKLGMEALGKDLIDRGENVLGYKYAERNEQLLGHEKESLLKNVRDFINEKPSYIAGKLTWVLTMARCWDGGEDGPFHEGIYRPIKHGEDTKFINLENRTRAYYAIENKHYGEDGWDKVKDKFYDFDFLGKRKGLSHEEIRNLAMNCGSESNLRRVFSGFKISQKQLDSILDKLDERDWNYCQDLGYYIHERWQNIVELERDARGIEPEMIQPRPVITKFGAYDGWYYPAEYDHAKAPMFNQMAQSIKDFLSFNGSKAIPARDYAKNRVYDVNAPLKLSTSVLTNHIEEVEHDLAFRKPLIDVQRFINQPEVQKALMDGLGIDGYKNIRQWLTYVAAPKPTEIHDLEKLLSPIYKSFMSTIAYRPLMLPLKYTSDVLSSLHDETMAQGNPYAGLKTWIGAQGNFLKEVSASGGFHPIIDRINELSPMMKNRPTGFEVETQSLKDIENRGDVGGFLDKTNRFGFLFERIADGANVYSKWWDKYNENLGKMDKQKAIDIADETIKQQFGTGSNLERTGIQRNTLGRIFAPAYSFASMMFQKLVVDKKMAGVEWNNGNKPAAMVVAAYGLLYVMAQGTGEYLNREFFKNEPDKKKWKHPIKNIATRTVETGIKTVPVIGESLGWLYDSIENVHKKQKDLHLNVVDAMVQEYLQPAIDSHDFFKTGRFTERMSEDLSKTVQLLSKSPQLLNTLIFNLTDAWKHSNLRWQDFATRRPRTAKPRNQEGE